MDKSEIESRFDLQSLDGALDSISLASVKEDVERKNFYDLVNYAICDVLANSTSLIFTAVGQKSSRLVAHSGAEVSSADLAKTVQAVDARPESSQAKIVSLSGGCAFYSRHDLERYQITYSLIVQGELEDLEKKLLSDLVAEVGLQISVYERNQIKKNQSKIQGEILKVTQLVRNLSLSKSSRQMAYTLVNDLIAISGADRISFFTISEGLLAISKVASFDKKNEVTRSLAQFARSTAYLGKTVDWSDFQCRELEGRKQQKLNQLTQTMGSSHGLAIPISDADEHTIGNLVFEYFTPQDEANFLEKRAAIENCVEYCSPLIQRMYQMYSIPYFSFWEWIFNSLIRRSARTLVRLGLLAFVLAAIAYALLFVQRPFDIAAQGALQPKSQRHVFAPEDGNVRELVVTEGDEVNEESVLVKLKSAQIEKELVSVTGEIAEVKQRLRDLELTSVGDETNNDPDAMAKAAAETQRLQIRLSTLQTQETALQLRKDALVVYSPLDGQVTTPNLEQRLIARPLNRGDIMMTVADLGGQWRVELLIPDHKISYLKDYLAQDGNAAGIQFRLASNSELIFDGELIELDFRAEKHRDGDQNFVKALVDVDEDELAEYLRIGTRVNGRINCGQRNLFFLLTHEFRDKLSEWFFF